ncbi:MAG: PEGA domain-containing protein [Myxococcota bacterium]
MSAERVALGVLGLALASSVARAQGPLEELPPRVYVVAHATEPELDLVAARAAASARAALRSLEGAGWQTADRRFLGYDDVTAESLREARRLLAEGEAAYLELRFADAVGALRGSVRAFDAAIAAVEGPEELGKALLFLGASHLYAGDRASARRVFERMQVQMPQLEPDPELFAEDVIALWRRARARRQDGRLRVTSDPVGGAVSVDFVLRGVAPVSLEGLAHGPHLVRVAQPGAAPYIEVVDAGRRPTRVEAVLLASERDAELAAMVERVTGQELVRADGPVQELGRHLELERIAVLRVAYGDASESVRLELVVFDVETGRALHRSEAVAPRAPGQLEPVVWDVVRDGLVASLDVIVQPEPEPLPLATVPIDPNDGADETPLYRKWWLWVGVGAVVATGIVLGVVLRDPGNDLGRDPGGQVVFEF